MQVFKMAPGENPSPRWKEAFPDAVLRHPPFVADAGDPIQVCWVSAGLEAWPKLVSGQVGRSRVVVVSRQPNDQEAIVAFEAGAHGYCHSLANVALLRGVYGTVIAGGLWVPPGVMGRMIRTLRRSLPSEPEHPPAGFEALTAREREVALAVTTGASNKDIASQLGLAERTVKMHLGSIFNKLRVRDRVHLVLRLAQSASAQPSGS
jgi:two-component system, NarL family, nitrate/nitrite response regulator NarL